MIKAEDIKKLLTVQDLINITLSLGAEIKSPLNDEKQIIFTSICHHKDANNHKPKLYLYKHTKSFFCYSCSSAFDIFSLIQKRKELLGEKCSFIQALKYVCDFCGIDTGDIKDEIKNNNHCDWQSCLQKYTRYKSNSKENQIYDKSVLDNLEDKYHLDWINEGISIETQQKFGIKWYNYKQQIVIPVYDDMGNFVGGHVRNLLPEVIEQGYKYMPFSSLSFDYSFNTGNILYGLNVNKENIRYTKTAILFEAPKSVMMLEDITDMNNSVALFGMNMQKIKRDLLMKYNCEHYIIALDRQYEKQYKDGNFCDENGNEIRVKTDEYSRYTKIIEKIVKLLKPYGTVDVIIDNDENRKLPYKASPIDCGKEVWEYLYKNRKEWKDIEKDK